MNELIALALIGLAILAMVLVGYMFWVLTIAPKRHKKPLPPLGVPDFDEWRHG